MKRGEKYEFEELIKMDYRQPMLLQINVYYLTLFFAAKHNSYVVSDLCDASWLYFVFEVKDRGKHILVVVGVIEVRDMSTTTQGDLDLSTPSPPPQPLKKCAKAFVCDGCRHGSKIPYLADLGRRSSSSSSISSLVVEIARFLYIASPQQGVISGLKALRQAGAPIAGLEFATEGSLQI
ncbi:hypothetical protein PoB_000888500 [Plakobranchus ocellatus]|uniref:Uncharacterized protein n=1 Tax=Plakobranchus ocellatus TaxID=259542 RepID=A0AAV3YI09_9GAST|nr:hypothetical protein PoB_000888500 [Plakobranchus ocellatus]